MRHRVRAANLILRPAVDPQEILLVKHQSRTSGKVIWLPPGGGLEPSDLSIFDCARREAKEESGLDVVPSRIAYVHEFRDVVKQIQHVAFYMVVEQVSGEISLDYLPPDATDALSILETTWIAQPDMANLVVYPEYLKTANFWQDAANGFPTTRYLGTMTEL